MAVLKHFKEKFVLIAETKWCLQNFRLSSSFSTVSKTSKSSTHLVHDLKGYLNLKIWSFQCIWPLQTYFYLPKVQKTFRHFGVKYISCKFPAYITLYNHYYLWLSPFIQLVEIRIWTAVNKTYLLPYPKLHKEAYLVLLRSCI